MNTIARIAREEAISRQNYYTTGQYADTTGGGFKHVRFYSPDNTHVAVTVLTGYSKTSTTRLTATKDVRKFQNTSQSESQLSKNIKVLDEIANLNDDWNGYGSLKPNPTAIEYARTIVELADALQIFPTQISPSAESGVAISFSKEDRYADLECLNSGKILAVKTGDDHVTKVWEVGCDSKSIEHALQIINIFMYLH